MDGGGFGRGLESGKGENRGNQGGEDGGVSQGKVGSRGSQMVVQGTAWTAIHGSIAGGRSHCDVDFSATMVMTKGN